MEIEKKQFRDLLLWFWEQTAKAQANLNAHQVAIVLLKAAGEAQGFDQFLEKVLNILPHSCSQNIRK